MKPKAESKKRATPDFTGVPGVLIASLEGLDLQFGLKKHSPYDALLDQLSVATDAAIATGKPLPGLKFGDVKAKASVYTRAKLKGFKVSFAITQAGELYARIDGRVDVIERRRAAIKKLLALSPHASISLAAKLREAGDATVDAAGVGAMMTQMQKSGEAVLQEGGAWKLIRK